jgi:hypothetical protein
VKQQVKPQPKPQVEQEKTPQEQIKINHEDGVVLMMKKNKIRRDGRARHPMLIQDANMMSKNQEEKESPCSHQVLQVRRYRTPCLKVFYQA